MIRAGILLTVWVALLGAGCAAAPQAELPEAGQPSTSPEGPGGVGAAAPGDRGVMAGEGASAQGDASGSGAAEVTLRHQPLARPWLGVELRATEVKEPGVGVVRIFPGSPAARAGLEPGDVIVRLGDERVDKPEAIQARIGGGVVGEVLPVSVLRAGAPRLLKVTLTGTPDFEDQLRLALVGKPAPSLQGVVTFQGEATSLKDFEGKVVLLEFWASWCGVCRFVGPVLDDWQRKERPRGLEVVGITVDPPSTGAKAAQRMGMTYTLMSDSTEKVTRDYMASQVPAVFVVDRRGIVVDVMVGYSKQRLEEVRVLLDGLLSEQG